MCVSRRQTDRGRKVKKNPSQGKDNAEKLLVELKEHARGILQKIIEKKGHQEGS